MKEIGSNIRNLQNIYDKPHKVIIEKTKPTKENKFNTILSNKLDRTETDTIDIQNKKKSSETTPALSEIHAPSPLSSINDESPGISDSDIPDKIDNTLDMLEEYSSLLSDPSKTLKSMDSVLKDINASAENIADQLQATSNTDNTKGDGELVKIVNQILSLVNVEQFKMYRGDYTDR